MERNNILRIAIDAQKTELPKMLRLLLCGVKWRRGQHLITEFTRMIFFDCRPMVLPLICLFAVGVGIFIFRRVKNCVQVIRWPSRILSALVVGLSSLLLFLCGFFLLFFSDTTASAPVYSPDGKRAFRVIDHDGGALRGDTAVMVHSHHGLYSQVIFSGHWKQAELPNVRWLGNSVVSVGYDTDYGADSYGAPAVMESR